MSLICVRFQPMQSCPNGAMELIARCNMLLGMAADAQLLLTDQVRRTNGKRWEAMIYCNGRACHVSFADANQFLSASEPYTIELPEGSFIWSQEDREAFPAPRQIAIFVFSWEGRPTDIAWGFTESKYDDFSVTVKRGRASRGQGPMKTNEAPHEERSKRQGNAL